jgi:hypothetical protein
MFFTPKKTFSSYVSPVLKLQRNGKNFHKSTYKSCFCYLSDTLRTPIYLRVLWLAKNAREKQRGPLMTGPRYPPRCDIKLRCFPVVILSGIVFSIIFPVIFYMLLPSLFPGLLFSVPFPVKCFLLRYTAVWNNLVTVWRR